MTKLITNNFYLLLLVGAVTFSSCDKKDKVDPVTDPNAITCKLTKVVGSDGDDSYESVVEYNAQGYVTKVTEKELEASGDTWVITYTYNSSNQLIKETDEDGDYETYEYDAKGLLIKENEFNADNTSRSVESYTYNAQGQLTQIIETYPNSNSSVYKSTFEYDARGNVSKRSYFSNDVLNGYDLFEDYDDKLNPILAAKGILEPGESRNNARKRTEVWYADYNGDGVNEEQRNVETLTYKYNASGFVTEIRSKEVGETEEYVQTFTYTGCN